MFCNSGSWFHVIHVLSRFQQLHNVPSPLSNMKTSLEQWQNPLLLDWQERPSGMVGLECHGWCGGGGWFMLLPPLPTPVSSGDTSRLGTRAHSRFHSLLRWGSSHVPVWSGLVAQILSGRAKPAAVRCWGRVADKDLSWPVLCLLHPVAHSSSQSLHRSSRRVEE